MGFSNLSLICFTIFGILKVGFLEATVGMETINKQPVLHRFQEPVNLDPFSDSKFFGQKNKDANISNETKNDKQSISNAMKERFSNNLGRSEGEDSDDVTINLNVDQGIESRGAFSRLFSADNATTAAFNTINAVQSNNGIKYSKESRLSFALNTGK
ncbi:uncharacterized protein LOC141849758 [Brevipalpus obovatus]|uniref:uncharacterized protein LOC141849758 n=1 Tax=Brevipalpus obovatus TaxID=246614 RepID=UPI003D9EC38A